MNRLQSQLHRLYGLDDLPTPAADQAAWPIELIDAQGLVRALVLELGRAADWSVLSAVWHGVQLDLGLPAPAIAVNGRDAYQLWFSLQTPVHASRAVAFLNALRAKYLTAVSSHRIGLHPEDASTHRVQLPPVQVQDDQWAAFLAPDLAPVFNDTPWLDLPPNQEGQAELLSKVSSITAPDLDTAMDRLIGHDGAASTPVSQQGATEQLSRSAETGPRQFLLKVMNDETVALHLRIEAAKALLPLEPKR